MGVKTKPTFGEALAVVGGLLALMWALEIIDTVTLNALDAYGIEPRQASDLLNIFAAPFLHYGWPHLISNSLPFLVLGILVFLGGRSQWYLASLIAVVSSGLGAWLLAPSGSITAGASGVIFGWLTYLLARGFFTHKLSQILVAVLVFLVYGGVLLGVLPGAPGVSGQGHLGGAIGGALAAWWLRERRPVRS